ncbi:AsmA family protein [Vibrio cincinnatiensis]|uniref:AsmA family protein n=1 Tax=Vibrio cincinnatiensis TaxID=675 RepID=UPI001EE05875|nr:AsmA family protein [Vibrio cincinnatiensis]MCG3729867.1 AsmA family protein [Vibrio cincinnatiensis]
MKKLSLFIAALLVIVVGAIAALVIFVNPNQFKPLIVEQTKKQTGLELVIEGDIRWTFFPSIGLELGKTELRNPVGFSQTNLFKVDRVGIEISVMPLLDSQLHIGNVQLEGAEVYLETLEDGRSNIDSLTQASNTEEMKPASAKEMQVETEEVSSASTTTDKAWDINLAGVTIKNARLDIQDNQAATHLKLYDVQLTVSEFAANKWTKVDFSAQGSNNQQQFGAAGAAEIKLSENFKQYALRNIALSAHFNDSATQIDALTVELATFEFDKANSMAFTMKGKAADLQLDVAGKTALTVDSTVSTVSVDKLDLIANLQGEALPQSPMKVAMNASFSFDIAKSSLNLILDKLAANTLELAGKASVKLTDIPQVRFTLHSQHIDLDEFLGIGQSQTEPAENVQPTQNAQKTASVPTQEVEPDLSALKGLDIAGQVTIDQLKAANAKLHKVQTRFSVNRGVIDLSSLTAELYQGKVQASAQIDARKTPATYHVKKTITGVKVQPLLVDVLNNKMLEGTGNIEADIQGKSLTPTGIQQNLVGTVAIKFSDGAVNGINIAQLIRTSYAKIKGQRAEESDSVKKTDFSAMSATLKLNKGEVSTSNLTMQSPLLRVHGEGKANYIQESVDFLVRTSIVGTLKGQGGKDIDELRDVTVPIHISGQWADPKFRLVFDDVLKQKAQKEIDRGIEKLGDKIKNEETKQAVDGLLKGLLKR